MTKCDLCGKRSFTWGASYDGYVFCRACVIEAQQETARRWVEKAEEAVDAAWERNR